MHTNVYYETNRDTSHKYMILLFFSYRYKHRIQLDNTHMAIDIIDYTRAYIIHCRYNFIIVCLLFYFMSHHIYLTYLTLQLHILLPILSALKSITYCVHTRSPTIITLHIVCVSLLVIYFRSP